MAESIAHDVHVLDDILNNQTKKPITVWRVQEDHFMEDNPKIGDILEYPNYRSTAISKEGALWFSKTNSKPMRYIIEYELPAGTKGAYLAPIKKGEKEWGEFAGEPYAREMEFLLKKHKLEIVDFEDKTVKGALGEDLKHIKVKVIDS